jgi:DNA modification methylase
MDKRIADQSPLLPRRATHHRLIIGDCQLMSEIPSGSIQLVVTSPPFYNAPFDYKDLFRDYGEYLRLLEKVADELFRVLADGRVIVLNIDDMLVKGERFPIVADATRIFLDVGFRYRDRIVWKKPDGYLRISRRSGVLLQNPYPMYFYPDNSLESILIFQKGRFDYRSVSPDVRELFSYVGETVLDPFCGSGTTMAVARELGRSSVGIEIQPELEACIRKKVGFEGTSATSSDTFEVLLRTERKPIICKPLFGREES